MNNSFREQAHKMVDWMVDYLENIEQYPVKSQVNPRDIFDQIPAHPPQRAEEMPALMQDVEDIIMPGITHWQHPNFHAYFPANSSGPSVLAEMLTATIGAQCMMWDTSPAAAELEERVMDWLIEMLGLPEDWTGVIQDTASTASLTAILSAREQKSDFGVNEKGLFDAPIYRVYCSEETHSSIDKAVKIAGLGSENLVKIGTDDELRMRPEHLQTCIESDLKAGFVPLCVIATLGTTGTTAIDPLVEIAAICKQHSVWLHVDAAYAGTALLLPEFRWMIEGIADADSFVFNPHKWMFVNFDCSVYVVKSAETLVRTFEILPEYLKTRARNVNHYKDWGVPLGRRFRALKLWFVIRSFGVEGLQNKIRAHINLAKDFSNWVEASDDFELMQPRRLTLVCFRYAPQGAGNLDQLNDELLHELNATGRIFLTHTRVRGDFVLRMVTAQTTVEARHIEMAWDLIQEEAKKLAR